MHAAVAFHIDPVTKKHQSFTFPRELDPSKSLYEWPNAYFSINQWYETNYGNKVHIGEMFGRRLILIKGEVFRIIMPNIINPSEQIPVLPTIEGLTQHLIARLSKNEVGDLQRDFNIMFNQANALEMSRILNYDYGFNSFLVKELVFKALSNLRTSINGFDRKEPLEGLWHSQQASEKFLKAFLMYTSRSLSTEQLKKVYNHKMQKLWLACQKKAASFKQLKAHVVNVDLPTDIRYKRTQIKVSKAIDVINSAFAIGYFIVSFFLNIERPISQNFKSKSFALPKGTRVTKSFNHSLPVKQQIVYNSFESGKTIKECYDALYHKLSNCQGRELRLRIGNRNHVPCCLVELRQALIPVFDGKKYILEYETVFGIEESIPVENANNEGGFPKTTETPGQMETPEQT